MIFKRILYGILICHILKTSVESRNGTDVRKCAQIKMCQNGTTINQSTYVDIGINDDVVLWNLNLENMRLYMPAAIFAFVLQIIGLVGNSLVIYIYQVHFMKTTMNLFIKTLAVLDVGCCLFASTFEIGDMVFGFINGEDISCKVFRGIEQLLLFISGEILVCIAVDRYLHVCRPLTVFTVETAKRMVVACVLFGIIGSVPTVLLVGRTEVYHKGVKTYQCNFDAYFNDGPLKLIQHIFLLSLVLLILISMFIFYSLIWIELCHWQKRQVGETLTDYPSISKQKSKTKCCCIIPCWCNQKTPTETESGDSPRIYCVDIPESGEISSHGKYRTNGHNQVSSTSTVYSKLDRLKRKRLVRPVIILLSVTVLFIFSFTPYFILTLLHTAGNPNKFTLSVSQRQLWETVYKFYFLSNAINPLIYATLDKNFRSICYAILFDHSYRGN